MKTRRFGVLWLAIALLIAATSFAGGDLAILSGWAFLLWTAPIGPVWWFYVYPMTKGAAVLSPQLLQVFGSVATIVIAYLFWFVVIPWLVRKGRIKRPGQLRGD